MRVQVGSHIEELGAGDTIYYNSGTPHGMIAIGGEDCEFYAIVMRPGQALEPEKDKFEGSSRRSSPARRRETVSQPVRAHDARRERHPQVDRIHG